MATAPRNYNHEYKDSAVRQYHYNFDTVLRTYTIQTFKPFLPKGRALELGCFKGAFTQLLLPYYSDLTVVEASDKLIAEARQHVGGHVNFINSTFEHFQPNSTYDAIFLIHTLEHLDQPIPLLNQINHWLSDDGLFFVAVPNANAPSRQIAVKMGLMSHNSAVTDAEWSHGHRITYTLDTLERDVTQAGLNVIHRGGIFFKPLANFQFDKLMETDIISQAYLDGCYKLGMVYPDLTASIYLICKKGRPA